MSETPESAVSADATPYDDGAGDPVCWLHLVCESCGALLEREGDLHRPGCDAFDSVRTSLHDLSLLTDAEQYFVWGWLATGARHYLYRAGVDDEVIGEARLFPDDERSEHEQPPTTAPAKLLRWVGQLKLLPSEFVVALKDWFFWHDRSSLYRIGLADVDIGKRRVMPDDIWSYEADYESAADRTLQFMSGECSGSVKVRVLLNSEWQDP